MSENNYCCKTEEEKLKKLDEIIEKKRNKEGSLISILHEAQALFGYLSEQVQQKIADGLGKSLAEVYGVATFYSGFSLEPKGKNNIQICLGTACYVKGADKILAKLEEILNIKAGEITPDGKFSIDATRCVGACGLAPVMVINGEVYGKVTPDRVKDILNNYE